MIDTGCALESPAMRSSEAATGTRTTMRACSISTTIGQTTTTTMSASAEPRLSDLTLTHLDDCQQASEGSILVESIPQDPAKARQQAKPKTAAAPTGAVVERGRGGIITQFSESLIKAEDRLTSKVFERRLKRGIYKIENNELHKYCNRCKEYWPADSEFFYATAAQADGLCPWCKACYLEWRYPNGRKKDALLKCKTDDENEDLNLNSDNDDDEYE